MTTKPFNISYSGFEDDGGKKVHYVSVGCQDHKIEDWLNPTYRNQIISKHNFPEKKIAFLSHLNSIMLEIDILKILNQTQLLRLVHKEITSVGS